MRVVEREPGDVAELRRRVRAERDALQRDRYRAVLLALDAAIRRVAASTGRSADEVTGGRT